MANPIITFTSDFGLADAYVAETKAAVLRHCAGARLVDVTHLIPAQNVVAGGFALERALAAFGPGTFHIAVVDPGVGTSRRLLVCSIRDQWIVCPDNGLITWAWRRHGPGAAFEINWRQGQISPTFHGRDILAPVAGLLASGTPIGEVAAPLQSPDGPVLLDIFVASGGGPAGEIIYIDHFGNAITNIPAELIAAKHASAVRIGMVRLKGIRDTYQDVKPGEPVALIGSAGLLEIAVRDASAKVALDVRVGDEVVIEE